METIPTSTNIQEALGFEVGRPQLSRPGRRRHIKKVVSNPQSSELFEGSRRKPATRAWEEPGAGQGFLPRPIWRKRFQLSHEKEDRGYVHSVGREGEGQAHALAPPQRGSVQVFLQRTTP